MALTPSAQTTFLNVTAVLNIVLMLLVLIKAVFDLISMPLAIESRDTLCRTPE
jgi:hypothetical protein